MRKSCKTCRLSINGLPGRCNSRKCLSTGFSGYRPKSDTKAPEESGSIGIGPLEASEVPVSKDTRSLLCEFCLFGPYEVCPQVCISGDAFKAKSSKEKSEEVQMIQMPDDSTVEVGGKVYTGGNSKPSEIKPEEDSRSYNVGYSDYAQHKIQPWDIWEEYNLNPWEADIIKRILRKKSGESRRLDLEKILHITKELIRQITPGRAR